MTESKLPPQSVNPLGKSVDYVDSYSPQLLCSIDRRLSRNKLGIAEGELPFVGVDIWNAYELSWLNHKGKPEVALAEFRFCCESEAIIESKSFKLYLNSLNQVRFDHSDQLRETLLKDLAEKAQGDVDLCLYSVEDDAAFAISKLQGDCLDDLDISIDSYQPDPELLSIDHSTKVDEQLYSHLLRSLCPVTGQPDWGSIVIEYRGAKVNREGLLKYLVGYRQHQEFHEQCVERIFTDFMTCCGPDHLSVYARYVRRGGLDINPFRSTRGTEIVNARLLRQ